MERTVPIPKPKGPLPASSWTIADSAETYSIDRWGNHYFSISPAGNVQVDAPTAAGIRSVELIEIIEGLHQRGLNMPVLLRLENLVDHRIAQLNQVFHDSIETLGYQGNFQGVFPIKVNQQRHVIDAIVRQGEAFGFGLEAGSKAELLVALASTKSRDSLIICNGYKDEEFVDLGMQSRRLGFKCFFVIESPEELELVLDRAKHWDTEPLIGARIKLTTKVDGHWAADSGDRSLFGLSTRELIKVVDMLKAEDKLGCLQMLHFHLGSQIPSIRNIRDGVHEACRYYLDLIQDGAPLGYFDLGGGLAVDYDGSASTEVHSRNYDLEEYCQDVIEAVMNALDPHGVPHPTLITESGRWTVAPMSILMFNILTVTHFDPDPIPELLPENVCEPIVALMDTLRTLELARLQENYNDAVYYRDQARKLCRSGDINLRELALAENISLTILHRVAELVPQLKRPPAALYELGDLLSDIYFGNFSVFQSLPDAWAIDHVFPVMPLHRLNEKPDRRAILADLTCDCDGQLNRFSNCDSDVVSTLELHAFQPGQPYYLGVFLVGAYQETLGDLHNLFGDTNVASVRIRSDGSIQFVGELPGDTIADVLSYVEHKPDELFLRFRATAEAAVQEGRITVAQRQEMLNLFGESLRGYTYFESE